MAVTSVDSRCGSSMTSEDVELSGMDEVGSEPAEGKSTIKPRVSEDNSVDVAPQVDQGSDAKPSESKANGKSNSVFANNFIQFRVIVSNLSRNLWREATDLTSPDWPPSWLRTLGVLWLFWLVVLILWLIIAVITPVFIRVAGALGLSISVLISQSKWTQFLLSPVHRYLGTYSVGLPFSSGQLFAFWIIFGIIVFFSSRGGSFGGRVGWVVFGIETGTMVWSETPEPSRWLATGLTAILWSLASISAYRKAKDKVPH